MQSICDLCIWTMTLWSIASVICPVTSKRTIERQTNYGTVRGYVDTVHGGFRVEKYMGIPYAKPPVGDLRFEAPVNPVPWKGVKETTELPPACPQHKTGFEFIQILVQDFNRYDEDCLYLNVFVPKGHHHRQRHVSEDKHYKQHHHDDSKGNGKYAVLVFIHGGSYMNGMGAMVDGSHLATHDVIVVTVNYRLGPLGFLEAGDANFPGNYGLMDQVAALRWIQENIHHFGGDKDRVTIDGHSAGGCSVGLLMLMPMAKGLFRRVIQQSGSPFAFWALTRRPSSPNFFFKLFTDALGCYGNGTAEVKACLKRKPSEEIQKLILEEVPLEHLVPHFRPVVDGVVIPDTPERLVLTGQINGQEILTGVTTDEGKAASNVILSRYVQLPGLHRLLGAMYAFSMEAPVISNVMDLWDHDSLTLQPRTGELSVLPPCRGSVLEQYYVWPYGSDESNIQHGFTEMIGDYFIAAPTQYTAEVMTERNVTVYFYNYDFGVVEHGGELFYLTGMPLDSSGHRFNSSDREMTTKLLRLWTTFAKYGLPSLGTADSFHMPPYTKANPQYTKMSSRYGKASLSLEMAYKEEKMDFWNHRVPILHLKKLQEDAQLLTYHPEAESVLKIDLRTTRRDEIDVINNCPSYMSSRSSKSWILLSVCIGLSVLTVLLSVCYCQVRRQVKTLIRQSSVASTHGMLQ